MSGYPLLDVFWTISRWSGSWRTRSSTATTKLADLHDRGVINDAEFEQKKEEILR